MMNDLILNDPQKGFKFGMEWQFPDQSIDLYLIKTENNKTFLYAYEDNKKQKVLWSSYMDQGELEIVFEPARGELELTEQIDTVIKFLKPLETGKKISLFYLIEQFNKERNSFIEAPNEDLNNSYLILKKDVLGDAQFVLHITLSMDIANFPKFCHGNNFFKQYKELCEFNKKKIGGENTRFNAFLLLHFLTLQYFFCQTKDKGICSRIEGRAGYQPDIGAKTFIPILSRRSFLKMLDEICAFEKIEDKNRKVLEVYGKYVNEVFPKKPALDYGEWSGQIKKDRDYWFNFYKKINMQKEDAELWGLLEERYQYKYNGAEYINSMPIIPKYIDEKWNEKFVSHAIDSLYEKSKRQSKCLQSGETPNFFEKPSEKDTLTELWYDKTWPIKRLEYEQNKKESDLETSRAIHICDVIFEIRSPVKIFYDQYPTNAIGTVPVSEAQKTCGGIYKKVNNSLSDPSFFQEKETNSSFFVTIPLSHEREEENETKHKRPETAHTKF